LDAFLSSRTLYRCTIIVSTDTVNTVLAIPTFYVVTWISETNTGLASLTNRTLYIRAGVGLAIAFSVQAFRANALTINTDFVKSTTDLSARADTLAITAEFIGTTVIADSGTGVTKALFKHAIGSRVWTPARRVLQVRTPRGGAVILSTGAHPASKTRATVGSIRTRVITGSCLLIANVTERAFNTRTTS
jgi:hypothetical protein